MKKVTLIPGDGIGKEISQSVLNIFEKANIPIDFEIVNAGFEFFKETGTAISEEVYNSIEKNKVALKGPLTTQVGAGYRSLNVALRKKYDLYANIREIKSIPNTSSKYEDIDLVIFRENTEGLYIGEEKISDDGEEAIAIKRITKTKSNRIIKKAFEYAKDNNISKVTVAHKANILKIADGLFLECAREISKEYEDITLEEVIIDNMCMQLVMYPEKYKCIVTMNLYGDILSDLAAGLIGGLGLAPGANIGDDISIFEAVHGSAPDIAGKNIANPTALILSSLNMLKMLNMVDEEQKIRNALFKTFENKLNLTKDLGGSLKTTEFTEKIIKNL